MTTESVLRAVTDYGLLLGALAQGVAGVAMIADGSKASPWSLPVVAMMAVEIVGHRRGWWRA